MKISINSFQKKYSFLLCIFLFISAGCLKKEIRTPNAISQHKKRIGAHEDSSSMLYKKADQAWKSRDMQESQRLYALLIAEEGFDVTEKRIFWERLIKATFEKEEYSSAYVRLNQWVNAEPSIIKYPCWQELWGAIVVSLPRTESIGLAHAMLGSISAPVPLKGVAYGILMLLSKEESKNTFAEALAELYTHTDHHTRIMLEQRLLALLKYGSYEEIVALESITSPEKDYMYPWSIIVLEMVYREWKNKSDYTAELLSRINYTGIFADNSLLSTLFRNEDTKVEKDRKNINFYPGCYALVLPMSGSYASIGWKVAKGASIAQEELNKAGVPVEVLLVNTEASGWLKKLKNLPPQCMVVGGPLHTDVYAEIKKHNILSKKVFFTFLPGVEDEGSVVWRFFPSPEDQIFAILRFSQAFNISSYGVVYPEDSYGKNMANLFIKLAKQFGISTTTITYDSTSTAEWGKVFEKITDTKMIGKTPVPSTICQALFLPDSWKNIEVLIPYLFFQGEDRLILAGTSLWEQGLVHNKKTMVRNIDLAIFPGGWNMRNPNSTAKKLITEFLSEGEEAPDFWVALGYDFVRFASTLNMSNSRWTEKDVNSSILKAQELNWSMEPISWKNGKAKQHVKIFQPISIGYRQVNLEKFKKRLKSIQIRHEKRIQAAEDEVNSQ